MILSGKKIEEEVRNGAITIVPFSSTQVSPNSYNFKLGNSMKVYKNAHLDAKKQNEVEELSIGTEGIVLQPGRIYLGHTVERISSSTYVPVVGGRSSVGRLGLSVHVTADLIDFGFVGQYTLMMNVVQPTRIYAGMEIGQITFWEISGERTIYDGKYQNAIGPVPSQTYRDFL